MSNPEFTIVMPVHNGANYIESALQSVLAQSYPHFSILVLENASTDNTLEIIRGFESSRITVVPSDTFLPIEQNWGRILHQPMSEFCTLLGHDDLLYPGFLEEAAVLIAAEPDASLYQVQVEVIDAAGAVVRQPPAIPRQETAHEFITAVMNEHEEVCGTGYIMRSDDYKRVGGIPPFPGLLYADVQLWYRVTEISGKKVSSPKTLAAYRVHPESTHKHLNIAPYYQALKQYQGFLNTIDTLPPNTVYAYMNMLVQRIYRNAAAGSARTPGTQPGDLAAAKRVIEQDGQFQLTDRTAKLYETIAALPGDLRWLALQLIDSGRAVRRIIR